MIVPDEAQGTSLRRGFGWQSTTHVSSDFVGRSPLRRTQSEALAKEESTENENLNYVRKFRVQISELI